MQRATNLGRLSEDCPVDDCSIPPCYEPCQHIDYVISQLELKPLVSQEFLSDLARSILTVQEQWIQHACEREIDLCEIGKNSFFPCLQCGLIDPGVIDYSEQILNLVSCETDCLCFSVIDYSGATQANINFSTASAEQQAAYESILNFLALARTESASRSLIDQYVKAIFGDTSGVTSYMDGVYYAELIQPSNDLLAILPIIYRAAPVPVGASLKFMVSACN